MLLVAKVVQSIVFVELVLAAMAWVVVEVRVVEFWVVVLVLLAFQMA